MKENTLKKVKEVSKCVLYAAEIFAINHFYAKGIRSAYYSSNSKLVKAATFAIACVGYGGFLYANDKIGSEILINSVDACTEKSKTEEGVIYF